MIVSKHHHAKSFILIFSLACSPFLFAYTHALLLYVKTFKVHTVRDFFGATLGTANSPDYSIFKTLLYTDNPYYWNCLLLAFLYTAGLIIFCIVVLLYKFSEKESLYGNASFATDGNVEKRFKKQKGLVLALYKPSSRKYGILKKKEPYFLFEKSNQFIVALAPTRCGKGVQVGIPNHLFWDESMVSLDIKGESYAMTSTYRKHILKQKVYVFNPEDANSSGYNPLYYVKANTQEEIKDLTKISTFFYPKDGKDQFWNSMADTLFKATALLLTDCREIGFLKDFNYCLGNITRLLSGITKQDINPECLEICKKYIASFNKEEDEDSNPYKNLDKALSNEVIKIGDLAKLVECYAKATLSLSHGEVVYDHEENLYYRNGIRKDTRLLLAQGYYANEKAENTLTGIVASAISPISMFNQYPLNKITTENDIDFSRLRKERMTVYVVIKPNAISMYKNFITLFFDQLMQENLHELPSDNKEIKYTTLLLLDEFPALGKIPAISNAIAYMAGYKLKLFLIMQSTSQLYDKDTYGEQLGQTMLDNINTKLIYAPANYKNAEEISKTLGNKTVQTMNVNYSSKLNSGSSFNNNEQSRALFLPNELMEMGEQILIMQNGEKPVLAKKFGYFQFSYFANEFRKLVKYKKELAENTSHEKFEEAFNRLTKLTMCTLDQWEPIVNSDLLKLKNVDHDLRCRQKLISANNKLHRMNVILNAQDSYV